MTPCGPPCHDPRHPGLDAHAPGRLARPAAPLLVQRLADAWPHAPAVVGRPAGRTQIDSVDVRRPQRLRLRLVPAAPVRIDRAGPGRAALPDPLAAAARGAPAAGFAAPGFAFTDRGSPRTPAARPAAPGEPGAQRLRPVGAA